MNFTIGKKFNKLTVIEECDFRKDHKKVYKCLCDCGNITYVIGCHLRSGNTKSCGCLNFGSPKHRKSKTRLYSIYSHMKQRCYNSNDKNYKIYGGRGIRICDAWLNDFMNFHNWAYEHGYNDTLTIDRIDVNGNYEPSNCRWVNQKQQCNNKRNNILLTCNGKTQNIKQWSDELGIKYQKILMRHRRGWSDKECLLGKEVK